MLAGADRAALLRQLDPDLRHPRRCSRRWSSCSPRRPRCGGRRRADRDAPLLGRVFKTVSEPHVGDVTLFRLYRGELTNGDEVWNAEHEVAEKLNHLSMQQGKERIEVERLHAGDIGSVAKLQGHPHRRHLLPARPSGAAPADPVPRLGGDVGRRGQAAGRGGQARRRAAQAARGRSHLPLRVQLGAGPDPDPRHGRAPLRDHPRPAGAEVRRARRAGPAPGRLPGDDQGRRPKARASTRSRPAAGASTATAGFGSARCRAAAATSSSTASWAG